MARVQPPTAAGAGATPATAPAQPGDDPATQGPMVTGINKTQAELVHGAPEKLKFYRQFGEVLDGLGKWDPVKEEFVLNEDVTDLYGSWDGNPLNPQNWNGFGDDGDAGGFGGGTEFSCLRAIGTPRLASSS